MQPVVGLGALGELRVRVKLVQNGFIPDSKTKTKKKEEETSA